MTNKYIKFNKELILMAILKTANNKGKYFDENSKNDVVNYIIDKNKTLNGYIGSKGFLTQNYAKEMKENSEKFGKSTGVQVRHFIIGFENYEVRDTEMVYSIGKRICDYLGNQFQTVFGVHEDTGQLHLHFAMNSISYIDGHRYYGTRKEFYDMKGHINNILKTYDIEPVRYISNKN